MLFENNGGQDRIRTDNLAFRKRLLCPVELQAHKISVTRI